MSLETAFLFSFFYGCIAFALLSAVLGTIYANQDCFWLSALFSTPLALYAGLGGNGIAVKMFLLTPVLLVCAGYAKAERPWFSTALVVAAFLPWAWLFAEIVTNS